MRGLLFFFAWNMPKVIDSENPIPIALLKQELMAVLPDWYEPEEKAMLCRLALQEVSGLSNTRLLLSTHIKLSEYQVSTWQQWLLRLKSGEPWQYITGETLFYDLTLKVNPSTLIPRPETEFMCRLIVEEMGQQSPLTVADIGTGSACIALALAAHLHQAHVHAFDISTSALEVAAENAAINKLSIRLHQWDALHEPFPLNGIDLLVSNPPYITAHQAASMRPNVTAFEPHLALFAPAHQPLAFYEILASLRPALSSGAAVYTEINEELGREVCQLFLEAGFVEVQCIHDLLGKPRVVKALNN
jgi:release factor glutamine methyltransferase